MTLLNRKLKSSIMEKIKVTLLSSGNAQAMAMACACCTGRLDAGLFDMQVVKGALDSGHLSIAEFWDLTFLIDGCSRTCAQQLTRYRHCSFAMESQRYVNAIHDENLNKATCEKYAVNGGTPTLYPAIYHAFSVYKELIKSGHSFEQARTILPNSTRTRLIVHMNFRQLIHICNERLCTRAEQEIRHVVEMMKEEVGREIDSMGVDFLKNYLVPKCEFYGVCTEKKSCGRIER